MAQARIETIKQTEEVGLFTIRFEGDSVTEFEKFANKHVKAASTEDVDVLSEFENAYKKYQNIDIIYEDEHIILLNKPAGILSQKAEWNDVSVNEWLIGYLLDKKVVSAQSLSTFRPSVCNRLDRNTSGMMICSKSLIGAQKMAEILKDRSIHKYYKTIVVGDVKEDSSISGFLYKDEIPKDGKLKESDFSEIKTSYKVLRRGTLTDNDSEKKLTELQVLLHTGKTHQIRAHLSSIGHPIIGDSKYGSNKINQLIKKEYGLKYQLLHSYKLEFPEIEGELSYLSGKNFEADIPQLYKKISDNLF